MHKRRKEANGLPSYYQAQCHMQLAVDLMQKKQLPDCLAHVEKAQSAIEKAKEDCTGRIGGLGDARLYLPRAYLGKPYDKRGRV